MEKLCKTCGITKDIEEFSKNRSTKDGHEPYCRTCRRQWANHRYAMRKHQEVKHREVELPLPPPPRQAIDITHPHKCPVCGDRKSTLCELYRHRETHDITSILFNQEVFEVRGKPARLCK